MIIMIIIKEVFILYYIILADTDCIYKLTPTDFRINMLISVYQTMCVISFNNESIKLVKPILELISSHLKFAVDIKNRDLIIAIIQLLYINIIIINIKCIVKI